LRHDVLEEVAGLERGRRLVRAATRPARRVGCQRRHRLEPGCRGLIERTSSKRGAQTGPNPTDRGKAGSKHHILTDANGTPIAESLTAANVHDTHELFPLLDAVPAVKTPSGRRRFRPDKLHADKAYSSKKNRRELRRRGIKSRIARPKVEPKERLGQHRWVVERSLAWLHQLRRLLTRYERRDDIHFGFHGLGCCLIIFRALLRTPRRKCRGQRQR
jgi:IS5 family transposase